MSNQTTETVKLGGLDFEAEGHGICDNCDEQTNTYYVGDGIGAIGIRVCAKCAHKIAAVLLDKCAISTCA